MKPKRAAQIFRHYPISISCPVTPAFAVNALFLITSASTQRVLCKVFGFSSVPANKFKNRNSSDSLPFSSRFLIHFMSL